MPELRQLDAFRAIAEAGSFRAAAERLGISQPALSARISALEQELGCKLFERNGRSSRLSHDGQRLLPLARTVIQASNDFVLAARGPSGLKSVLRLGVTEVIVYSWLPSFTAALQSAMPQVELQLTIDLSAGLSRRLVAGELDLCFQTGPFPASGLAAVPLDEQPLIWIGATPDLTGISGPADLAGRTIAVTAPGTEPYRQLTTWLKPERADISLIPSGSLAAARELVRNGLATGLLPEAIVRKDIQSGSLTEVQADWHPDPLQCAARFDPQRETAVMRETIRIAKACID